ncbi:hypothetical protein ACP70R_007482 [Stipagrostis hirtigluma subsp. patula]
MEFGGLGLLNLEFLGYALRMRWLWLHRTDPSRTWSGMPLPTDRNLVAMFQASLSVVAGNGTSALFWTDRWLDGQAIKDIAPDIFNTVPASAMGAEFMVVPNVIPSETGNAMPSYVTVIQQNIFVPYVRGLQSLDSVGRRVAVGEIAKRQILRHPSDVIFNTKKLIGKKFDDDYVQEMRKKVPFGIVEGPRGEAWVEVHGMKFSPVEMTRAIFEKLKDIVQMNQFHHVLKLVISVPAFFNEQQRKDIKSAGNRAGFEVLQLIDEPIAAARSSTTVREGVVVVFGMGAGSYSISILDVSGTNIETKVQFDDPFVGGDQFDDILLDYFVAEICWIDYDNMASIRGR